MNRIMPLLAAITFSSILGCASTQQPQKLSDEEAAMQELNRQRTLGEEAKPAPQPAHKSAKKK